MFTPAEARSMIRKAIKRVPEGEEIRHLNIMPMMDMMTILLVAFVAQIAVASNAAMANSVVLPATFGEQPMPETAALLIITKTGIVVEGGGGAGGGAGAGGGKGGKGKGGANDSGNGNDANGDAAGAP